MGLLLQRPLLSVVGYLTNDHISLLLTQEDHFWMQNAIFPLMDIVGWRKRGKGGEAQMELRDIGQEEEEGNENKAKGDHMPS